MAEAPVNTVKKLFEDNLKRKKEQFKKRFKRLNERISVAKYPKRSNFGKSKFSL